jgi:hypothetical protein
MKNITLKMIVAFMFLFIKIGNAQSAGFNSTYAVLSINGGANVYYDLQATTGNPDFEGTNLGNFNASNSLLIKGAEHNVYKCGGCDLTSTRLYYRIYNTGTTPGGFSNVTIGYSSGFTNGCGGEDQQWSSVTNSLNVLSGLSAGTYTLEVYSDASVTCSGGTVYAGNSGANYKANFTYCGTPSGPLTAGNYSIPGCFTTVAAAASYLNTNGVSGSGIVQFDVASGHTETAPSTGIVINGNGTAGSLATGTANLQILFKKSGSGANPKITAPTWTAGGNTDGIIKIVGGDYITFDGFTLEENPLNTVVTTGATNTMTEIGIGLFLSAANNGAQNNTVKNCVISLNNSFPNSIGIFSTCASSSTNTNLSATSSAGTNSFNKIQSNSISNVAYGIYFITMPVTATVNETGNEIGGNTALLGNSIIFGNVTISNLFWSRFLGLTSAGIVYRNGGSWLAQHNTVTSNVLSYTQNTLGGIIVSSATVPSGISYTAELNNNTINLFNNGTSAVYGIDFGHGISTSTHIANNNSISIEVGTNTTNSALNEGIRCQFNSTLNVINGNSISINQSGNGTFTGAVRFINVNNNKNDLIIQNNILLSTGSHIKTTSNTFGIAMDGSKSGNLLIGGSATTGNTINIQRNAPNNNFVYAMYGTIGTSNPTSFTITHNIITISNLTGSANGMGIYNHEGVANLVKNISNNTITISGTHTGVTNGLFLSNGIFTVNNNVINNTSGAISNAGIDFTINGTVNQAQISNNSIRLTSSNDNPIFRGIGASLTSVINGFTITNNTIESITATSLNAFPTIFGIRVGIGNNNIISGNIIKDISTAASSGESIISGIDVTGTSSNPSIFNNKIFNIESLTSGSNSILAGISAVNGTGPIVSTTTLNIYNNFISDIKAPNSNSINAVNGILCYASGFRFNLYYNTIKLGTNSALSGSSNFGVKGINVSENSSATILDLRNNIININANPSGNGYAACVSIAAGTSGSVPLGFATTSNNNIYHINSNTNNFLFAQGADALSVVNGFAVSGLTQNISNNIINDTNFNATCGYYKTFMGGSLDAQTFTENNLINGTAVATFVPSGSSFAENGAQLLSITNDFDGISRTPTNDIGALQFVGTTQTYSNPSYSSSVSITSTPVSPVNFGTAITFTAVPVYGGFAPTYQWYNNNVAISGETNATYITTTLNDNEEITVQMVSNDNCSINPNATSNGITYNIIYPYDTNVINPLCGATLTTINQYIFANLINVAQLYRFRVTDLTTNQVQIADRSLRVFHLTQLASYAFDRTYKIEVAVRVNNVWQPYGNACNVTTPIPLTQLTSCGQTLSLMNQTIFANNVPFSTGYRFKVTNTTNASVQIIDRPIRDFRMVDLIGPQYNTNYTVEVAVRNTNGVYLPFGPACNVLTPPVPTSQITASQCAATVGLSTLVFADNFINTTIYRFKFENTNLGFLQTIDRTIRNFTFSQVPGVIAGQTYQVSVSIQVGGVFGPYNTVCNLTIAGGAREIENVKPVSSFNAVAYPNPYLDHFKLNVTTSLDTSIQVRVYDMLGKQVENRTVDTGVINEVEIGENFPAGVYNVIITQGSDVKTLRVIKR